jgi:hypothetical protein
MAPSSSRRDARLRPSPRIPSPEKRRTKFGFTFVPGFHQKLNVYVVLSVTLATFFHMDEPFVVPPVVVIK